MRHITSILMCIFASLSLSAQPYSDSTTAGDYFNLSLEELMNIEVVSATKIKQTQAAAPNIITVVPRQQVEKFGWLTANEILYAQAGFAPSHGYDRRTVGFRGMFESWSNNHVLMLVDGVPMNDNLYGTAFTWDITPLVFANSLEIIRGPGGALYGNNAMSGVLSFNTLSAGDIPGNGEVRLLGGNENTRMIDAVIGTEDDNFGMVTAFSHFTTDGIQYESYDASGRTDENGKLQKFSINDRRNSLYFFNKVYGKGKFHGLSFQYHEQHWDFETGHGWLFSIPDKAENMREMRRILSLSYMPRNEKQNFNYEMVALYQIHGISWNMRYIPDQIDENATYPYGVTEFLQTNGESVFGRLQADYKLDNHRFLVGTETNIFFYNGDRAHEANIDMNDSWLPFPGNGMYPLDPWFEFIVDKPVYNVGMYAQYISPMIFNRLQLTLSGRYDNEFFEYEKIYTDGTTAQKSYKLFTPRAALVWKVNEDFTLKGIAGQAFKTPSPTDLFGSNTYTLASNIEVLEPERITNFDFSINWSIRQHLNWRMNFFFYNFENQMDYSGITNAVENVYKYNKMAGVETEVNFSFGQFSGFANYTFNKQIDEEVVDPTVVANADNVMWAPTHTANFALLYNTQKFSASIVSHYQGEVLRRQNEKPDATSIYRPETISAWLNLDAKISYKLTSNIEIGLIAKNLTNQKQYIIKRGIFPFDYRREGIRTMAEMIIRI